jgi:galactose mutarotase-like enzyme
LPPLQDFPGNLSIQLTYTLTDDNQLIHGEVPCAATYLQYSAAPATQRGLHPTCAPPEMPASLPGLACLPAAPLPADIVAVTDKTTPVGMFSHPYFNLAGMETGETVLSHKLKINA